MSVRMVALRRCLVKSFGYEFGKGEHFDAKDEAEAKRLERGRLAARDVSATESPTTQPESSEQLNFSADGATSTRRRRRAGANTYDRRDLRAGD